MAEVLRANIDEKLASWGGRVGLVFFRRFVITIKQVLVASGTATGDQDDAVITGERLIFHVFYWHTQSVQLSEALLLW